MKVKCIGNENDKRITIGKCYDIIDKDDKGFLIEVDDGTNQWVYGYCFENIPAAQAQIGGTHYGIKHDQEKLKPTLLFDDMPLAIQEMLKVLKYGADKYAEGNWLKVDNGESRYRNACDRHRLQSSIEEYDAESGLLHLAHEAVNAVMLLELKLRDK